MSTVGESTLNGLPPAVTAEPVVSVRPGRHGWVRPVQVIVVVAVWFVVMGATSRLGSFGELRPYALFSHLIFLAISFGAVLAVEVHGLAVLMRLSPVRRAVGVATSLDPLIWG